MKPEELASKITFTVVPDSLGITQTVQASITFTADVTISCQALKTKKYDLIAESKECLKKLILARIYEDRHKEMAEAVEQLVVLNPWQSGWHEKVATIMRLAKHQ